GRPARRHRDRTAAQQSPVLPDQAHTGARRARAAPAGEAGLTPENNDHNHKEECMNNLKRMLILLAGLACGTAHAEMSGNVVRVGVLNDISGIFQDTNGMGSVEAARMAAEDFAGGGKDIKVEIVYADHQNKADVGAAIARKWLDVEGVDAIVDVPN